MSSVQTLNSFTLRELVGKGTFGEVFKGISQETGEVVAIKQVPEDGRCKNEELEILKSLSHPNIVGFRCNYSTQVHNRTVQNIVMDYHPLSLGDFLSDNRKRRISVDLFTLKLLSYALLRGTAYLHAKNIVHRDIKSHNLLINHRTKELKICDFGSAKVLDYHNDNISYICSRYYRAPELIFGATDYGTAIDLWSVGCVIGEIATRQILFKGNDNNSQLISIIKMLGTPSREEVRAMNPSFSQYKFPHVKVFPLARTLVPEVAEFLKHFFVYDPAKRITALEALKHSFFDELRDKNNELTHLFSWTEEELALYSYDDIKEITPEWYSAVPN